MLASIPLYPSPGDATLRGLHLRVRGCGRADGPPLRAAAGQVSCDWWRADHVTSILPLIGQAAAPRRGEVPREPAPRARGHHRGHGRGREDLVIRAHTQAVRTEGNIGAALQT